MPAKTKKIVPYQPATKFPSTHANMHRLLRDDGYKIADIVGFVKEYNALRGRNYWSALVRGWDAGEITEANISDQYTPHMLDRIAAHAFPVTPTFRRVNEQFLAEYDSRGDLQEIYKIATDSRGWAYTLDGECRSLKEFPQYKDRPESFLMYSGMVKRCVETRQKIELSRRTPYQEGDLVLLRKGGINRRGYDPLYVPRYGAAAMAGQVTPDETVQRIGTVISVTEKTESYHAAKGSKLIKVLWMGVESGTIHDIPEKFLKWHMRPTYANGMKIRE